ncbi:MULTISPECIES: hypothetical protein [Streptomyces]|uniref:Uncharacterized protein n=1 Tax=Streptomyces eurythermus TaxID=42237 RepID=A0ABW6Z922_9ACTN|nr:hypothetical protein [Streptomyces sp. DSM 40868]QIS75532.1 hypothetical protein HB370_41050 [Streptomyces sp. DSM 40868]
MSEQNTATDDDLTPEEQAFLAVPGGPRGYAPVNAASEPGPPPPGPAGASGPSPTAGSEEEDGESGS